MNFTEVGLKQKYENKLKNAKSRGIEFKLSEQEFIKLCLFLKENRRCAYTNQQFVFTAVATGKPKPNYPTLERIDNTKGYEIGNVIWVTYNANFIKSKYEDKLSNNISFTKSEFKVVEQILSSQEKVKEQLKNIYQFINGDNIVTAKSKEEVKISEPNLQAKPVSKAHPHSGQEEENNNSESKVNYSNVKIETTLYKVNDDVNLAAMYAEFAGHCKDFVDFLLSFNEYKRLMQKKQCQLTCIKFDEEHKRSLFVIDKTKPINVKNLLVVDLELRHNLDHFIGKMKIDQKALKRVFSNLGQNL